MEEISANDLYVIKIFTDINLVSIRWLPDTEHMSEMEFHEALDILFNTSDLINAKFIYIDAFDFNYPILERSVRLISKRLDNCSGKTYSLIKSRYILGQTSILRLIKKLNHVNLNLKIFETPDAGKFWIENIRESSSIRKTDN